MYSAFQSNAFQNNAFQIIAGTQQDILLGGGPGGPRHEYHYRSADHGRREREHQQKLLAEHHAELKRVEEDLAETERLRQEALAEKEQRREARKSRKAAMEAAALELELLEEINKLRIQRAWLMRRIDDEEAILVLLLSMPFVH